LIPFWTLSPQNDRKPRAVVLKKRIIYISITILLAAALFSVGRMSFVSDYLKDLVIPELELITGKKAGIGSIKVNLLPLFVEIDDTVISDSDGRQILSAGRVKGYISLSGLLFGELIVKRLAFNDTVITIDDKQFDEINANIRKYFSIERKDAYKVSVRTVLLARARFDMKGKENKLSVKAGRAEVLIPSKQSYNISLRDIMIAAKGIPELSFSADTVFSVNGDSIGIKSLKIETDGSKINTSGRLVANPPSGEFRAEADILADTVKKIFGLTKSGEGSVSAGGIIRITEVNFPAGIFLDLKIKGSFYLETLMELLNVDEKLEGHVSVEGEIKGPLKDLHGNASAEMRSGNLFGVVIDSVACKVNYGDRSMTFSDANARLYGGSARAEARIELPVVNQYSFSVDAKGVNSKGIFELINWDPGIANGKVDGQISSSGSKFNPRGFFSYKRPPGGRDVLDRVNAVEGIFSMTDKVISFQKMMVSTGPSSVNGSGSVDLNKKRLDFSATGASSDVYDISFPYFRAITGQVSFLAAISGSTLDPVLDIKFKSDDIKYLSGNMNLPEIMKTHTMPFSSVEGNLTYRKNMLLVNSFRAMAGGMKLHTAGKIGFRKSKHLFDIPSPEYDLQINFDNGDLSELAAIVRGSPQLKGSFQSVFTLKGIGEKAAASGSFRASDIVIADAYSLEKADSALSFENGEFNFRSLTLKKGTGVVTARGMISLDKRYMLTASLNNLELRDIIPAEWREKMGERNLKSLSLTDVSVQGNGTVSSPVLDLKGLLRYRDPQREHSSGYGKLTAGIKGDNITLSGKFMDGKIAISGIATLNNRMPWRADIVFNSARSDFLVALFLNDIPEDLLVNLKGEVKLWGDNNSINGLVALDKAYLYGFGYGFTNSRPISVRLQDKIFSVESFAMKNELAELRLSGSASLGKNYNLAMEGASSLAPLRTMFRNLEQLKGDASFRLALTGDWEKPRLNGKVDVVNGALGIRNIPHRMTAVNARIVADGERIVLEEARGALSGGDVVMSGSAYLDQLRMRRFLLDAKFNNVTFSVSKNFWVHSDGKLTYQGNLDSQNISGDINITKARYTERVDWKSWLIQSRKSEVLKLDLDRMDQTGLNIRVSGNNLSVDNNVLRAAMKMDILLKGSIGQPTLLGRLESTSGIVYFRNNEFSIIKGVIDFAKPGEIKPFFDVLAETRIKNYTVRFALDGYIDQFNLALSSTPTLDEGDILSLMAAGDLAKNLKGLQGGIGAGEATSFLTGKLQDVVEDRLKTVTGLDRLQIDPSVSRTTGTVSPRVTISKRLIGDRFYATYSTAADVGEGQIIKLEYLLNKNTSLLGVRDEKGGIGADIKFRFQFK
jgi:autotransporter translocation and assembly factor TamB